MIICLLFGKKIILYLRKFQKQGQPIREDGPSTHYSKSGTPTMGGLMIIGSSMISALLFADLTNPYIWICIFVLFTLAMLGLYDDYTKLIKNNTAGISARKKLITQILIGLVAIILISYYSESDVNHLNIPFFKNLFIDIGYFYIPFGICVIIGSSNAVNLTDGLDGLATGSIIISISAFIPTIYISYVSNIGELVVICSAIVGSCMGFLWYNAQPAEIFMGDTGSLSLGGFLGVISVITKQEFILLIIGGVFVIETLSVIIQVFYFKKTGGKRVFLMTPIHHHFERAGIAESKIVIRFWILSVIFALIGLLSLKLK